MTFAERALYHQIHPVKLVTDGVTAVVATYLFWRHELGAALLVGLTPPLVVWEGRSTRR